MSSRDWLFRLDDILESLERINEYTEGLNLQDFEEDQRTIDAVVRNLEIIGEGTRLIPNFIEKEYPTVPWRHMRDMRNILIHEYFEVDIEIIWQTISQDLPFLKSQLEDIKKDQLQ